MPEGDRRAGVGREEVLAYARRIARFAVPSALKKKKETRSAGTGGSGDGAGDVGVKVEGSIEEERPQQQQQHQHQQSQGGKGMESLEEFEKQWLDPWTGWRFTPWPGEEVLKRGALGEIQALVEKGMDPARVAGGGGEGGEKVEVGEEGDQEMGEGLAPQMMRAERREEKPKVFGGLDLYDPDEEG